MCVRVRRWALVCDKHGSQRVSEQVCVRLRETEREKESPDTVR